MDGGQLPIFVFSTSRKVVRNEAFLLFTFSLLQHTAKPKLASLLDVALKLCVVMDYQSSTALLGRDIFQSGALTYHGIEIVLWLLISADVDLIRGRGRAGAAVAKVVPLAQHEQFQSTHQRGERAAPWYSFTDTWHFICVSTIKKKPTHPNSTNPQVENGNYSLTKMTFLRIGYLQNAACWSQLLSH